MSNIKISVLTVTKRPGSMDILLNDLMRQTFPHDEFEWVLVDELFDQRNTFLWRVQLDDGRQGVDFDINHCPVAPYEDGRSTTICRAHNIGFAQCHGELIVLLQDYVYIESPALQQLWDDYVETVGKKLIGSQWSRWRASCVVTDKSNPRSIFDHWCDHNPSDGGVCVYQETRPFPEERLGVITSEAWEGNFAAVPKKVVDALGGIDEDYDLGPASYDNQNLSQRAELLGYPTTIDPAIHAYGFDHYDYFDDRPGARVVPNRSNVLRHQRRIFEIQTGLAPLVKEDYLARWR